MRSSPLRRGKALGARKDPLRAYLAVLLRNVVLHRDGYRCRKCGKSQQQGAVRGVTTTFSLQQSPPHVDPGPIEMLPPEFIREKVTREPDKRALKEALEKGETPGEAKLVPGGHHLVVR